MSAFTTIALRPQHAARVRELAKHFEMNVAGYAGTVIDLEYLRVFGREPEPIADLIPILNGKKLTMTGKDGQTIDLLLTDAPEIATMIYSAARTGGAVMKVDGLRPVAVSRKGRGVIIESKASDGKPMKITLSVEAAVRFATKLHETLTNSVINQ